MWYIARYYNMLPKKQNDHFTFTELQVILFCAFKHAQICNQDHTEICHNNLFNYDLYMIYKSSLLFITYLAIVLSKFPKCCKFPKSRLQYCDRAMFDVPTFIQFVSTVSKWQTSVKCSSGFIIIKSLATVEQTIQQERERKCTEFSWS